jgi:ABC-type Na+ efflux pump permease subunit
MCAPAAGAWLYGRIAARGRVPWLRLAAIAAVAIGALQVQLIYRAAWTRGRWQSRLFQEWFTLGDTIDQFRETAFAVKVVPSAHPFFHESVLFQFLASPIPRVLWPGKPVSQVVRFFTLERWNIDVLTDAGNVFPGILGQFYMSWGASGVVGIAALFAFGAALVDRGVRRNAGSDHYATAIWLMAATFLVLSFRVLAPAPGYPIVLCWILVALARARWRRAGAQ